MKDSKNNSVFCERLDKSTSMYHLRGEISMTITKLWGGSNIVRGHYIDLKNGEIKFVQSKDGELYGIPRKKYTRTHPYPTIQITDSGRIEPIRHFKALPREKASIIMMRRLGSYSINMLSKASGRSTSWIHTVLSNARSLGLLRKIDNRKLPRKALLLGCRKRMISLLYWMKLWQPFIFGEEDDPP